MSQATSLRLLCGLGLAAGAFVALVSLGGPARADKVGVAAAVNPDAFSSLSGSPQAQLNIGKSIFFNERINTTGKGLVQVLLVDGSTFTVGPGSDLVIDKFVYDPNKKTGEVVATFTKGAMRFVGGKISKNEGGVTVNTPSGALAIRGGMFQGSVNGGKGVFSFLYGVNMTLTGKNGQQVTVFQPGNTIDTTSGAAVIRPTTTGDVNALMNALSKGGTAVTLGGSGDKTGIGGPPKQVVYETLSLQDLISEATQTQINDQLQNQDDKEAPADTPTTPADTPTTPTGTPADTPTTPTDTTQNPPPPPPPLPTTVTARVLTTPGTYTAFPGIPGLTYTTDAGGDAGILGGDTHATGSDFIWTFNLGDRLTGTVSGLTDSHCTDASCEHIAVTTPPAVSIDFPATFQGSNCVNGVCLVTDATITQNGHTTTYEGLAVLKKDFFAYQLIGAPSESFSISTHSEVALVDNAPSTDPLLIFGGKGYNFGTPSGRTFAFELTPDVKEVLNGAIAPFSGGGSAPGHIIGPAPSISPLLYKETDSNNPLSRAVWLQTSLYINTTPGDGEDQQSLVNVALGGTGSDGGLVGARRGGASVDLENFNCEGSECGTHRDQVAFTGDIATLAGPDGKHFLGKDNPNIVIGFDSTGTHNIGRDIPLNPNSSSVESQSGSAYHVGVGLGALPTQPQTFNGQFQGYAAGMVRSEVPSSGFVNVVTSRDLNDFGITFDQTTNTLSANLTVRDIQGHDGATSAYNISFGDNPQSPSNRSAYVDDRHYAAIEGGPTATSVNFNSDRVYDNATSNAYLLSGDQLLVTSFFPDTFPETSPGSGNRPFCTGCDFLKWGAWGARVTFGDNPSEGNLQPSQYTDNVHLGWWVAGNQTAAADLNELGNQYATAHYDGHVLGDVAKLTNDQWKTYVAAGDLVMNWDFACRKGDLTISNFDGNTFGTGPRGLTQPIASLNQFGGALSGSNLSGSATGSFANNISNDSIIKAGGVMGNWNVAGERYRAGGIFAGSGVPTIPTHD